MNSNDHSNSQEATEFEYVAIDPKGKKESGKLTAASEREAMAALKARSLFPVSLVRAGSAPQPNSEASQSLLGCIGWLITLAAIVLVWWLSPPRVNILMKMGLSGILLGLYGTFLRWYGRRQRL